MSARSFLLNECKSIAQKVSDANDMIEEFGKLLGVDPKDATISATEHTAEVLLECLMWHGPCKKLNKAQIRKKIVHAIQNDKQGIGYNLAVFFKAHHSLPGSAVQGSHRRVYLLDRENELGRWKKVLRPVGYWVILVSCITFGLFLCFQQIDLLWSGFGKVLMAIHESRSDMAMNLFVA